VLVVQAYVKLHDKSLRALLRSTSRQGVIKFLKGEASSQLSVPYHNYLGSIHALSVAQLRHQVLSHLAWPLSVVDDDWMIIGDRPSCLA